MAFSNKTCNVSFDTYIKSLKTQKMLGEGSYGRVYQHPTIDDVVVKVFCPRVDSAYFSYLNWCLEHQDNKYVPKIYGVEIFNQRRGDNLSPEIGIVFLEKLNRITSQNYISFAKKVFEENRLRVMGYWGRHGSFNTQMGGRISYWDDALMNLSAHQWGKISKSKDIHLSQVAKFMAKNTDNITGFSNDCHTSNLMLRNGQIVFTDVIC